MSDADKRTEQSKRLFERIMTRSEEIGVSARELSKMATGKPDLIRDIGRGSIPLGHRLQALAEVMQTSVEELLGDDPMPAYQQPRRRSPQPARPSAPDRPPDVPILGTALGAPLSFCSSENGANGEVVVELTMLADTQEVGVLRRLPGLEGKRDIYAVYVHGSSMEPRYHVGDAVFVDPHKPAANGDDVIVQLAKHVSDDGMEFVCSLIKRLVRATPEFIELEQYSPAVRFLVNRKDVARVHRVVPLIELVGL